MPACGSLQGRDTHPRLLSMARLAPAQTAHHPGPLQAAPPHSSQSTAAAHRAHTDSAAPLPLKPMEAAQRRTPTVGHCCRGHDVLKGVINNLCLHQEVQVALPGGHPLHSWGWRTMMELPPSCQLHLQTDSARAPSPPSPSPTPPSSLTGFFSLEASAWPSLGACSRVCSFIE